MLQTPRALSQHTDSHAADSRADLKLSKRQEGGQGHSGPVSPKGTVLFRHSGWDSEPLQLDHVAVIQSFTVHALDGLSILVIW